MVGLWEIKIEDVAATEKVWGPLREMFYFSITLGK